MTPGLGSYRRLRVFVTGIPTFAESLVRLSAGRADVVVHHAPIRNRLELLRSFVALARSDVWYIVGSVVSSRWLNGCARIFRKRRIMHWIGSDILLAEKEPAILRQFDAAVRHLTTASWSREELAKLGIEAKVVPTPPLHRILEGTPLPARFTALVYVPAARARFYGINVYEELGRIFGQRVAWIVLGGARPVFPPGVSVDYVAWSTSMAEIYTRSTVLIRCVEHDGLALSVIEALGAGRHVLWTYPFPGCEPAGDFASARASLASLLERHERGELDVNREGARVVRERFDRDVLFRAIRREWEAAAAR